MGSRPLLSALSVPFTAGLCLGQTLPMPAPPRLPHAVVQREEPSSPTRLTKGRFLVASRTLDDPNFAQTVILLLSADAGGAIGVIINRPTRVKLASLLPDLKDLRKRADRVFIGGPVSGNVLVVLIRAPTAPAKSERIVGDVYATGNLTALHQALTRKGKPLQLHAYVGYTGWGPGQLEREVARGDWHIGPAESATIFDMPSADIWPKLIERFSGAWTRAAPRVFALAMERSRCSLR